jgi:hypothetical protein
MEVDKGDFGAVLCIGSEAVSSAPGSHQDIDSKGNVLPVLFQRFKKHINPRNPSERYS